jgi:hypothetical protein
MLTGTRSVIKGLPAFIVVDPLWDLFPIKWQQTRLIWVPPMIRWLLAIAVVLAGVGAATAARADVDSDKDSSRAFPQMSSSKKRENIWSADPLMFLPI